MAAFRVRVRERGRKCRVRGRCAAQRLHLLERAIDEEIRRRDFESRIVPHPLALLVEHHGKGAQPCEVSLGIVPAGDLVLPVEKGRHALIGAGQLADHVGNDVAAHIPVVEGRSARDRLHLVGDRVVVGKIAPAERAALESLQSPQLRGVVLLELLQVLERRLRELRFRPGVLALVEPKRGQLIRVPAQPLIHEDIEQSIQPRARIVRGRRGGERGRPRR